MSAADAMTSGLEKVYTERDRYKHIYIERDKYRAQKRCIDFYIALPSQVKKTPCSYIFNLDLAVLPSWSNDQLMTFKCDQAEIDENERGREREREKNP